MREPGAQNSFINVTDYFSRQGDRACSKEERTNAMGERHRVSEYVALVCRRTAEQGDTTGWDPPGRGLGEGGAGEWLWEKMSGKMEHPSKGNGMHD